MEFSWVIVGSELFGKLGLSHSWTHVTVKFNVSLLLFDSRIFCLLPGMVLLCVCVCFFLLSPYIRELLCWRYLLTHERFVLWLIEVGGAGKTDDRRRGACRCTAMIKVRSCCFHSTSSRGILWSLIVLCENFLDVQVWWDVCCQKNFLCDGRSTAKTVEKHGRCVLFFRVETLCWCLRCALQAIN